MLTGELPFRGSTRMLLNQVHSRRAQVAPGARTIESRLILRPSACNRWPRSHRGVMRLRASSPWTSSDSKDMSRSRADRSTALERTWRWCRRNPKLAFAVASTAASLVAVAVLSVVFAVNARRWLVESYRHLAVVDFHRGQVSLRPGRN